MYYELLQPGTTINAQLYKEQLIQLSLELQHKRPEYAKRHEKVILHHDDARHHFAKLVKETLLGCEVLPHPPYSTDIALSYYHLFRSMQSALTGEKLSSFADMKNWRDNWIASKTTEFFYSGIHLSPER